MNAARSVRSMPAAGTLNTLRMPSARQQSQTKRDWAPDGGPVVSRAATLPEFLAAQFNLRVFDARAVLLHTDHAIKDKAKHTCETAMVIAKLS